MPALFLHGGPGGGCSEIHRRYFDPERYRIVLFDQRGAGRSEPLGGLAANTTAHLVADVEALRAALAVERFVVLGGSWGAALALAYALAHPGRVAALVLRGVFTARRSELAWLYGGGAGARRPDEWRRLLAVLPDAERDDVPAAYDRRLRCGDPSLERAAAAAWCGFEDALAAGDASSSSAPARGEEHALALARIEAHYARHAAFLEEGELLRQAPRLRGIPGVIVQGERDLVTPPATARELHVAWPGSELRLVAGAGHASSDPGIARELVAATDAFAAAPPR